MRLGYVIVYAPDVVQAIEFYEKAFGLTRRFIDESGYGELDTGETALGFTSETLRATLGIEAVDNRPSATAAGVEIALRTDDVEAAYDKAVAAGAQEYLRPDAKPWGQTVAYVRDLNGFLVELCTPVAAQ